MRYFSSFAISFLLLCNASHSQDTSGYVYVDSSIIYPESKEEKNVSAPQEDTAGSNEDTSQVVYVDTSLVNSHLTVPADSIETIKNTASFAYARTLDSLLRDYQAKERAKQQADEHPSWLALFLSSGFTKILFWILAIFFILFIVYRLFFTQGFFQRSTARSNVTVLSENDGEAKGTVDYTRLIANAAAKKDYRLAVRYLYLQCLQQLATSGSINFAADKTNAAYLKELAGKPYKNEFAALTLHYEYAWYGEFTIDEPAFLALESRFRQLLTASRY